MVTSWKPRLSVRALKPVIAGLEVLGHPVAALLARAGIIDVPSDADGHLPNGAMGKLWEHAIAATGDKLLGMHVALAAPVNAFDVHGYAMLSSPTLRAAYDRACRYQRLINEGTELTFREESNEGVVHHALSSGRSVSRQPAEFLVTTWLRLGRLVTGTSWSPTQVFFAHDRPEDIREYDALFGAPVQFSSGRTAMHVPKAALDLPNPRADTSLLALLDRYAATLLERQPPLTTVSARVRAWLVEAHGGGAPTAQRAGAALAMSMRTLNRHLEQEGTTFRRLLDQFRHEKSVMLLATRRHSIAEVAFLLGYSELSAFYRAFRRWTGRSPADLRDEGKR